MAALHVHSSADETDRAISQDAFPEVAYFEVPSDLCSKSVSSKAKDLVKHPAFREISAINGEINRMTVKHLKVELDPLGLDSRGNKDVLRKRLKAYERRRVLTAAGIEDPNTPRQHYTHLLVIDFEATCEEHQTKDYVHEIIEFPAVLVRVDNVAVVAEFHRLVRPVLNPTLSPFCSQLTGIPQDRVDSASTFPEVLNDFEQWLTEQGVSDDGRSKLAVATDGPWDMARFLLMQCNVSKLPFPTWARSWINLRKIFSNFYVTKRLCLSEMLSTLGLEFRGRPHCGLDDARNIAAIAEVLVRDGAAPRVNETIAHLPRSEPPSLKGSNVSSVTLKEFETSERRRLRASGRNARPTAAACSDGGGDAFINASTLTESANSLAQAVGGGTLNTVDGVSGVLSHLELSGGVPHINGNYGDVIEGGSHAMMSNGHSTSYPLNAVVEQSAGHTNGYARETVLDGEEYRRYQNGETCPSFRSDGTNEHSSYVENCYSINSSRRTDSPSHNSSPSFSSTTVNSSYSSPQHSTRIRYDQDQLQNVGGNDSWARSNGCTETTSIDFLDSCKSVGDLRYPGSNSSSSYPVAPIVSPPSSDCNTVLPLVGYSSGNNGSNYQENFDHNSMPYVNIEYPSSGVASTTSSASPRSISRQSSYADHNSTTDHYSPNSQNQDNGLQALSSEAPHNKNATGLRRPNNRRRNNTNNNNHSNSAGTNCGNDKRPLQHNPINKGNVRYPNRNFEDSATNSSSRGKQNRRTGGKPGSHRMDGRGGGSAASFFSQTSTPTTNTSAAISMDLTDTNEFPVLGSAKRCPR